MSQPTQASFSRRLMLGFGALISIFILFGVFTLYDIHRVSKLSRTVYNHPLVVSNTALEANASIARMHRSMKDVVLFNSFSRIQQSIKAVNAEEKQVYRYLDIVKNNILGEKGKDLEIEARNLFDMWRPIRNEVIGLVNNHQRENAANITIEKGANHVALLEKKMIGLKNYAINKASEFTKESERVHSRLIVISTFFLLLGTLISLLVAFLNIKWTVSIEKKLRTSENKYRQVFNTNKAVKLIIDPNNGKIVEVNEAACSYYGYSKKKLMAMNISDINVLSPEDIHLEMQNAKNEKRLYFNFSHRLASGKQRDVEVYSGPLILGEKTLLYSIVHDITDRKLAEEALVQSESRQRTLVDTIPDLVWLKDQDGVYLSCNKAFERFFGAKESEIVGKTDYDFVDKDLADFFRAKDRKAMVLNRPSINEEELTFADNGYSGLFETIKTSMRDNNGNLIGVLGIARDISERQRAAQEKLILERQLKQSQKMESIGNLAGGIAHDFNNILSSVIGFTELSLDEVEKGTHIEDNLQEVYAAGKRAKDLVRQILAFARQSEEELKPIQVDMIATEVLKLIRSSIPTTIEIKQNVESDSLIMGNATQIHQILMNLFTNAAHAMEDKGGILEFSLKDVVMDRGVNREKQDLKPGNYIEIKVSDTGTGIPPKIINSIFEPYFTTKGPGEGTGMGLAMVHGIVESCGGNISVDSTPGEGTTFTIYLPITRKRQEHRPYEPGDLPSGTERILFIDDEAPIAKMGSQVLERLGYSVTTRTSSVEALELFRAKPNEFDLVISDMTMPNMTGDVLAVELMTIRPDLPVILCTGYSKKISDENAAEIGIKAFAYKPIVKADLARTVRKVLDEAKG